MRDDLLDPYAVLDTFVDDFTDQHVHNGNFRCVGYTVCGGRKIVAVRLVMPANVVPGVQARARAALNGVMVGGVVIGERPKLLS